MELHFYLYLDIMKPIEIFFQNIKDNLPELEKLLEKINCSSYYEDVVYRFYHYSYKVYWAQDLTLDIMDMLNKLAPEGTELNPFLKKMLEEGTGKKFKDSHNKNWMKHTRPMIEAFFHAKYFLEMAVKYGKKYDKVPEVLDSGLAGLLYLFNLR